MSVEEAIILAGGKGTRLSSVVSAVPKPLAPVAGRPFLAWVLDRLDQTGIRKVIFASGYMAEQIERFAGRRWGGMEVAYSVEDCPLGTGGAVRKAAALLQGRAAHVLNGDTFLRYAPSGLERATYRSDSCIGVALASVSDISRYGAVLIEDGKIRGFQEKGGRGPGLINAGSYFFATEALDMLLQEEQAFSLETRVLAPQAEHGHVAAFSETSSFIDIGVPEDYERAQSIFGVRR